MKRQTALAAALLATLAPSPPAPAASPAPLGVALVWHQHQPLYPKRPGTRIYEEPWVRLHAAKDYVDMATMLDRYPKLRMTINLTPVLLEQIEDYNRGASDRHAQLAGKPAEQWSLSEKQEARRRFFQLSGPMRRPYPRLAEIEAKPETAWTARDGRDLATLFHLAWLDADYRNAGALKKISLKGHSFTEEDKELVLAAHRRALAEVIPTHRRLQDAGRLEVSTTPYFHPILPLLLDTQAAQDALPGAPLPKRFSAPTDAAEHVKRAAEAYRRWFGRPPAGMWPAEGSVSPEAARLFARFGVRWIATDEEVLERSLGGAPLRPAALYRPYALAQAPGVRIVFRDRSISDAIGFTYGGMDGAAAARDCLARLGAIAASAGSPRVVTIILDGENAWEHYPDDGKAFLDGLYRGLTSDPRFEPLTVSQALAKHPAAPLAKLWRGSWIGASFATWIGEPEENAEWEQLAAAHAAVQAAEKRLGARHAGVKRAKEALLAAEGSDWFWWAGRDQDSGRDEVFAAAFAELLASAYREAGLAAPASGAAPPAPQASVKPPRSPLSPTIDGSFQRLEWMAAGAWFAPEGGEGGGAMHDARATLGALFYGRDEAALSLALQFTGPARAATIALTSEGKTYTFKTDPKAASARVEPSGRLAKTATGGEITEIAVPWQALGGAKDSGLRVKISIDGRARFEGPLP